ncbi:MAG: Recombination protein RecR [Tenericutes bacterium ADurb.Bin239]|nr:MAG: Recombination protein RecR [Tenericutes bacterium ADurb.Bin239]
MDNLPTLNALIEHLKRLPSVGQKSAERMAQALLTFDDKTLKEFGTSISELREKVHLCKNCGLYTENELCSFCLDPKRNNSVLIVVSYPKDVLGFSKLEDYHGRFHILGGVISPSSNKGIELLAISELEKRIVRDKVEEIILATNPTVEGELTALFVSKKLAGLPIKITRLAYGLPMGGQVDYADAMTLFKALEGRKDLK